MAFILNMYISLQYLHYIPYDRKALFYWFSNSKLPSKISNVILLIINYLQFWALNMEFFYISLLIYILELLNYTISEWNYSKELTL